MLGLSGLVVGSLFSLMGVLKCVFRYMWMLYGWNVLVSVVVLVR